MADKYRHVVKAIQESAWAILPAKMDAIVELVRTRASGAEFTAEEIRERIGAAAPERASGTRGKVAVIPVQGVLAHRMNMFSSFSGGTSTEGLTKQIQAALDDASVSAIVFDIDSPGGSVDGIQELGDVIFGARGKKPMTAVANALCASAAYWLAAQADELVVTPSGQVGSIGVLAVHQDLTKQAEMLGVKVEYISAGAYKTEGQPFEPLTDEARGAMQARVDEYYSAFVGAVARGRGVSADAVRKGFGQGRVVSAQTAVVLGMAGRIDTLDATIERLNASAAPATAPARRISMEDATALKAQIDDLTARLATSDATLATVAEDRRQERIRGKADAVTIPAFRPFVQALYDLATRAGAAAKISVVVAGVPAEFTAETVLDKLVGEINGKAKTLFLETALHKDVPDPDAGTDAGVTVDQKARAYMAEHKTSDYRAAVTAVLAADPALKAAYAKS